MMNRELREIEGYQLRLRLVAPGDAAYIHALRTDPRYNVHLSAVTGSVEDQRRWIEIYRVREAQGSEYYYVIERLDGVRCGVVRLYDIRAECFKWGSWILDDNKPSKAALESAILSFGVGFEKLGLKTALFDVRHGNDRAISFYRRFGATETGSDPQNIYFEYGRERYLLDRRSFVSILEAAAATGAG